MAASAAYPLRNTDQLRYEKRKAPRHERPAQFQYCLRAWLSREPRRMGTPQGSSCEKVKRLEHAYRFCWEDWLDARSFKDFQPPQCGLISIMRSIRPAVRCITWLDRSCRPRLRKLFQCLVKTFSTARLIVWTPVLIEGSGTGAKSGE